MGCGVGRRHASDPVLLWLWRRPAASALIGPLAWEPPYAASAALKRQKKTTKKNIYIYIHMCIVIVTLLEDFKNKTLKVPLPLCNHK